MRRSGRRLGGGRQGAEQRGRGGRHRGADGIGGRRRPAGEKRSRDEVNDVGGEHGENKKKRRRAKGVAKLSQGRREATQRAGGGA